MATNSAGVNFGKPNEEFIIESDGSGALTSARNAVTGTEYVGAGNFSQVIEGTLAAPFGDYMPVSIGEAIYNGGVSGRIAIDASALGVTIPIILPLSFGASNPADIEGSINGVTAAAVSMQSSAGTPIGIDTATQLVWRTSIDRTLFGYMNNQYFNLPDTLPTTVTLYWHPMSE